MYLRLRFFGLFWFGRGALGVQQVEGLGWGGGLAKVTADRSPTVPQRFRSPGLWGKACSA